MNKFILITISLFLILSTQSLLATEVHRVSPGETLYSIARDYGVLTNQIINKNNLKSEIIFPRQILIIPEETVYYVRPGDNLKQIAEKLGLSINDLGIINELSNHDLLYPGQILKIVEDNFFLNTSVSHYKVQPGDTLYKISMKYGASVNNLIRLNSIEEVSNMEIGQVLLVPEYTFSEMKEMYPENFFLKGRTDSSKIALTFDDGPDEVFTPQILDVLNELEVPATFFYTGRRAEKNPELVERTVVEKHTIANHTWSHPVMSNVSDLRIYNEIMDTEKVMAEATGLKTALMRPPYGMVSQRVVEQLQNLDYRIIQWSVDSLDWHQDTNVDQILINTIPDIKDDAIILFHSAGGVGQDLSATIEVLPELIYSLEVQGYEFVTVDELLNVPAYKVN